MKLKKVITPGSQFDIEPHVGHLVPIAFAVQVRKSVSQTPHCSTNFFPRHLHPALNSTATEINHNEAPIIVLDPTPGHQILKAWIVGPTAAPAQPPFTIAKYWRI